MGSRHAWAISVGELAAILVHHTGVFSYVSYVSTASGQLEELVSLLVITPLIPWEPTSLITDLSDVRPRVDQLHVKRPCIRGNK